MPNPATYTPDDGEYTVQNIMNNAFSNNLGAWWRIADHTIGTETGRMMVVNEFNPGSVFFRDTVVVQPNTNYLFSSWILNLFKVTGYANPALGVRILDENNNILYSATLGEQIPVNTNAPEWKEISTVINSGNNTNITVEFLSEGPAAIGNEYAIDDISLREIKVTEFIPLKTINTPVANVGEIVTYTVTLDNTCTSPLTDVFFSDIVPNALEFVLGSITINLIDNVSSSLTGVEFSIDGGVTWNRWTGSYNIGTLRAGTSITIIIESMINSLYAKEIINTARVSSTTCDLDLRNNTATVVIRFNPDNDCCKSYKNMKKCREDKCCEYMKDDFYK